MKNLYNLFPYCFSLEPKKLNVSSFTKSQDSTTLNVRKLNEFSAGAEVFTN